MRSPGFVGMVMRDDFAIFYLIFAPEGVSRTSKQIVCRVFRRESRPGTFFFRQGGPAGRPKARNGEKEEKSGNTTFSKRNERELERLEHGWRHPFLVCSEQDQIHRRQKRGQILFSCDVT